MVSLCLLLSVCTVLIQKIQGTASSPLRSFGHVSAKQTAKTNNGKQVCSAAAFPPSSKCRTHFPQVSRGTAFNWIHFNMQLLKSSLVFFFFLPSVSFERGRFAELSRNVSHCRNKATKAACSSKRICHGAGASSVSTTSQRQNLV